MLKDFQNSDILQKSILFLLLSCEDIIFSVLAYKFFIFIFLFYYKICYCIYEEKSL